MNLINTYILDNATALKRLRLACAKLWPLAERRMQKCLRPAFASQNYVEITVSANHGDLIT